jgi:prepilin-type N-terminal cleavage/methylation domain-containing protein
MLYKLNRKRAFTLIELLVVIAIIAILAAILFPVFAQAKNAAKKAVSMSNMRQVGLASMVYMGDYDDTIFPLYWFDPTDLHLATSQGFYYYPLLLLPYTKNEQIFRCPNDTSTDPVVEDPQGRSRFDPNNSFYYYLIGANPSYGYNYRYLNQQIMSPDPNGTNPLPYYFVGISTSGFNTASTVLFAEATMKDKVTPPPSSQLITNPVGYSRIEPPSRWTGPETSATAFGQIYPRFDKEMVIVTWLDGHAKVFPKHRLKVPSSDINVLDSYYNGRGQ